MINTTTQTECQKSAVDTLQENIIIETNEDLSSKMLFTPENCRVWWQGYFLPDENLN